MRQARRMGGILLATSLFVSGCYGPFNLTRQLHTWNGQLGDKYVNELVFLGLAILPVYAGAVIGDAVLFNSIEFWTGRNPVFLSLRATPGQSARLIRQAVQPEPRALP